jgi:hypothetical protein
VKSGALAPTSRRVIVALRRHLNAGWIAGVAIRAPMRHRLLLAVAGLAAALAAPLLAALVTRDQLVAMAREKVDPSVMRAIVERDCVDFDVDAANASELSKILPPGVLEAAIECRQRASSGRAAEAAMAPPAAAAAPATSSGTSTASPAPAAPTRGADSATAAAPTAGAMTPSPRPVAALRHQFRHGGVSSGVFIGESSAPHARARSTISPSPR